MPDCRQTFRMSARTVLTPCEKPPPWIDTRAGVGASDLACQKSRRFFAGCGPYLTSALVGDGSFGFSWAAALMEHVNAIARSAVRFIRPPVAPQLAPQTGPAR